MLLVAAQGNILEDIELRSYDSKCKDWNSIVGGACLCKRFIQSIVVGDSKEEQVRDVSEILRMDAGTQKRGATWNSGEASSGSAVPAVSVFRRSPPSKMTDLMIPDSWYVSPSCVRQITCVIIKVDGIHPF